MSLKEFQNDLVKSLSEDAGYDVLSMIQDYLIDHEIDYHMVNKYPYDVISYLIELGIPSNLHYLIMSVNRIEPNTDLLQFKTIKIINREGMVLLNDI